MYQGKSSNYRNSQSLHVISFSLIVGFFLMSCTEGSGNDTSDPAASTAVVAEIEFGVEYYWQIRAINPDGAGPWTKPAFFITEIGVESSIASALNESTDAGCEDYACGDQEEYTTVTIENILPVDTSMGVMHENSDQNSSQYASQVKLLSAMPRLSWPSLSSADGYEIVVADSTDDREVIKKSISTEFCNSTNCFLKIRNRNSVELNHVPIAVLDTQLVSGQSPLSVQLDGSLSRRVDSEILNFEWNIWGRYKEFQNSELFQHEFTEPGQHVVMLTVTDSEGNHSETFADIIVSTPDSSPSSALLTTNLQDLGGNDITRALQNTIQNSTSSEIPANGPVHSANAVQQPAIASALAENIVEQSSATETPATETPATETPATETPATETPATETPATETPATETPVTETPVTETPVTETPATETPATETPATETPATETPVTETPATETPVTETPVTETPVTETPRPITSAPNPQFEIADDTEYGPTQLSDNGNVCPRIPTTFSNTYLVSNTSQYTAALSQLKAGEAIIIKDGANITGNHTVPASASGTPNNRAYIIGESYRGASLGIASMTIKAEYLTTANLNRVMGNNTYVVEAKGVRIACNYFATGGSIAITIKNPPANSTEFYDDVEIDNNYVDGSQYTWYFSWQCHSPSASCKGVAKRHHIHHNTILGNNPQGHYLYFGLGYSPENLSDVYSEPKNRTGNIFENNYVEWKQPANRSSSWAVDIKTGANTFRNNCLVNTKPINIRQGHHNVITGNWFAGSANRGASFPSFSTVFAYNYFGTGGAKAVLAFHGQDDQRAGYTELWSYSSSYESVVSNNVFNGYPSFVTTTLEIGSSNSKLPPLTLPQHFPNPEKMHIKNNIFRKAGPFTEYENRSSGNYNVAELYDLNEFRIANPDYEAPTVLTTELDKNVTCGTLNHVNGLGGATLALPTHLQGGKLSHYEVSIPAPSWW